MKSVVSLVLLTFAMIVPVTAADEPGRLAYEIIVTNPGTRSQGWTGTLYGTDGAAMVVDPGKTVETPVGTFVSVACRELWVPCGMIEQRMADWMKTNPGNAILDGEDWSYRLYVGAEGSKSEAWTGQIVHAGTLVDRGSGKTDTPMGPFVWVDSPYAWGEHGWLPMSLTAQK
jgi:hypothetical protein